MKKIRYITLFLLVIAFNTLIGKNACCDDCCCCPPPPNEEVDLAYCVFWHSLSDLPTDIFSVRIPNDIDNTFVYEPPVPVNLRLENPNIYLFTPSAFLLGNHILAQLCINPEIPYILTLRNSTTVDPPVSGIRNNLAIYSPEGRDKSILYIPTAFSNTIFDKFLSSVSVLNNNCPTTPLTVNNVPLQRLPDPTAFYSIATITTTEGKPLAYMCGTDTTTNNIVLFRLNISNPLNPIIETITDTKTQGFPKGIALKREGDVIKGYITTNKTTATNAPSQVFTFSDIVTETNTIQLTEISLTSLVTAAGPPTNITKVLINDVTAYFCYSSGSSFTGGIAEIAITGSDTVSPHPLDFKPADFSFNRGITKAYILGYTVTESEQNAYLSSFDLTNRLIFTVQLLENLSGYIPTSIGVYPNSFTPPSLFPDVPKNCRRFLEFLNAL